LKPPVLKTGVHFVDREFESRPLRHQEARPSKSSEMSLEYWSAGVRKSCGMSEPDQWQISLGFDYFG
jgi:hypothetical protein